MGALHGGVGGGRLSFSLGDVEQLPAAFWFIGPQKREGFKRNTAALKYPSRTFITESSVNNLPTTFFFFCPKKNKPASICVPDFTDLVLGWLVTPQLCDWL